MDPKVIGSGTEGGDDDDDDDEDDNDDDRSEDGSKDEDDKDDGDEDDEDDDMRSDDGSGGEEDDEEEGDNTSYIYVGSATRFSNGLEYRKTDHIMRMHDIKPDVMSNDDLCSTSDVLYWGGNICRYS